MTLDLVPAIDVVHARDTTHAVSLLRAAGHLGDNSELHTLAQQVVDGSLILVRQPELECLDSLDDLDATPLVPAFARAAS